MVRMVALLSGNMWCNCKSYKTLKVCILQTSCERLMLIGSLKSLSVADALEYCEGKLKLPQFQGCGPTVKFIRVFDHLFDVLNSRNPLARNFKALIRSNYDYTKRFLNDASAYIQNLRGPDGQLILTSKRKTGFLGFLVCSLECRKSSAQVSFDVQDEPRPFGVIFRGSASMWRVE